MRAVVKVSGKLIENQELLHELAVAVSEFREEQVVLVHGGGPAISELLQRLGIEPRFHAGQRVTDAPTLEVTEMVLSGKMNKTIVAALVEQKVAALGLSGRDAGLLEATPVEGGNGRLGLVGEIRTVRVELLDALCRMGFVPVISPISAGPGGEALNVNADWAAARIAATWRSDWLLFFGDTPGVLVAGAPVDELARPQIEELIATGEAGQGMVPKLRAALHAAEAGVGRVRILNWRGPSTLAEIWRDGANLGTLIRT